LNELQQIVKAMRETRNASELVRFRMADFAAFALRVGEVWKGGEVKDVLARLTGAQSDLVLEQETIPEILDIWLEKRENRGREATSAELQAEWAQIAEDRKISFPFKTPKSLGQKLSHLLSNLREKVAVELEADTA